MPVEHSAAVVQRVQRFLHERLAPAVVADRAPLDVTAWTAPGEPVPFAEAVAQAY
jgi:alpha-mannosidase